MTDPLLATIHCPKPTLLSEILLCHCCDTPAHPKSTMCLQLNSGKLIFQWTTRRDTFCVIYKMLLIYNCQITCQRYDYFGVD
ncbi:hypothetical protein T05_14838 [Trichinella murrelli]|uniref:Uncharacterized protein n=1 Tax=Trichinella murrelli TaxID=144512 RepID=A0A0V0UG10_9BILA|nr:hypothetical protein T05_14838 [Trichinella murrelli]